MGFGEMKERELGKDLISNNQFLISNIQYLISNI